MKKVKILICDRLTGHILNQDAKTVASTPQGTELPYLYFDSFDEVDSFVKDLFTRIANLEIAVYLDDNYVKTISTNFKIII